MHRRWLTGGRRWGSRLPASLLPSRSLPATAGESPIGSKPIASISVDDVSVIFPIFDAGGRSLKSRVVHATTGGGIGVSPSRPPPGVALGGGKLRFHHWGR